MTFITGPVPPFNNPPIQPQNFQPSRFVISAISTGVTTIITTDIDHNYVISQEVRLLIPISYGSTGLNEQTGFVISIPSPNQVELNIFSIGIDPFIASPTLLPFQPKSQPQIVAIGDVSNGIISSTGRVLNSTNIPGSFINISR